MSVAERLPVCLILLLTVVLSLWRLVPPAEDIGGFATESALEHLRFIASEPRPTGSPHHKAVRDYLVARLTALGYEVEVQYARRPIPLRNVLARRAGTRQPNRAVLLAAHYDTVRAGPGAGDDGAAVAALLEVARVLAHRAHPNDLIFLITDAEELGLLGARAFTAAHPWAADVGAVLNFEARGTSGPSIMFQTSRDNAWLIDLYARHAPHPVTSSVSDDIYRLMPNDTDFTIFCERGRMSGMNFAFIGGYASYHTADDDLARLDPRSLRHHGLQALGLAEALAAYDPVNHARAGPRVYFDVLSIGVVSYPQEWVPALGVLVSVLAMGSIAFALARRLLSGTSLLWGVALLTLQLLAIPALCWALLLLAGGIDVDAHADLTILASVGLSTVLTATSFQRQRPNTAELAAIGLVVWTLLTVATCLGLRGGSYLTTWPLLFATAAFMTYLHVRIRVVRLLVLVLAGVGTLLLLTPVVYLAFLALSVRLAPVLVAPVVLALWLFPLHLGPPPAAR